tara:strand:- start:14 stop:301 length:288 start_codon:yes stop_codon:yes gene_type:complete
LRDSNRESKQFHERRFAQYLIRAQLLLIMKIALSGQHFKATQMHAKPSHRGNADLHKRSALSFAVLLALTVAGCTMPGESNRAPVDLVKLFSTAS